MSFILDALRKSEHERQRSTVPGLSQVPLATPQPQMPRWALAVMAGLVSAVLALAFAWIYSTRGVGELAVAPPPTVERSVELPPPRSPAPSRLPSDSTLSAAAVPSSPARGLSLSAAAASSTAPSGEGAPTSGASAPLPSPQLTSPTRLTNLPDDSVALPSVAMLAAEGIAVPPLHLELHAFSSQARDRFVFINGRKYVEGDRLAEGPQLVTIAPTGAVLTHAGRRFILVQE